ncbi:MAG: helicase-related protein, partial [Oribacterium sp.]
PALSLVVTDEQQRFGVLQRKALSEKGSRPHILLLSATPIPRTLSLLLYQDMQVSRIPGRPAERLPVKNALIGAGERGKAWRFLAGECRKGRQAYIICPMIEDNGEPELQNVSEYQRKLRAFLPEGFRIEGLHGRMRAEEKERIMESFLRREIDILVSTTVVEVGVDVPNASVILIENAERFGLAQLHQLRGRVGRSALQSYCILLDCKNSKKSRERLSVLVRSNDGFWIAEEDLRLRGPGELFGIRQSGAMQFRFADIYRDKELWKEASRDAAEILEEDPGLSEKRNEKLRKRLYDFEEAGEVL